MVYHDNRRQYSGPDDGSTEVPPDNIKLNGGGQKGRCSLQEVEQLYGKEQ